MALRFGKKTFKSNKDQFNIFFSFWEGLSLVFILGMVSVDASVDYCQYKCNNGQTNIGCNNNLVRKDNKMKSLTKNY